MKITNAVFYDRQMGVTAEPVWQYDYGDELRICGLKLPAAVEIHFALTEKGGESITRVGVTKDNTTIVTIPDTMLENGDTSIDYNVYAWIYFADSESGHTEYKIRIPVCARAKPAPHDTPEEAELFKKAIAAVNESASRAEAAGAAARSWATGDTGTREGEDTDNAQYYARQAAESAKTSSEKEQAVSSAETAISKLHEAVVKLSSETSKNAENAAQSDTAAGNSAASASASEQAAIEAAGRAERSESATAESEKTATVAATAAEKSAAAASSAQQRSEAAQAAAAKSAEAAATSEQNASSSETASAQSAQAAAESEKDAGASAAAASTSEKAATAAAQQTAADRQATETAFAAAQKSATAAVEAQQSIQASADQIETNKTGIESLKEDTAALQKHQNVLVGSEIGNPIAVDDAFSALLCGLNVYGRSTQDGTPTPDAPVPIVSAGDGGSVTVKVTGKNLLHVLDGAKKVRGLTITAKDGLMSISGTATDSGYADLDIAQVITSSVAILSSSIASPRVKLVSKTWGVVLTGNTADKMSDMATKIVFIVTKGQTYDLTGIKVQLELGSTATAYSPYREQILTLPTPNGLPGIPVTSGGNYTDPQGQQWVCDEVDLERGVKVQRVKTMVFSDSSVFNEDQDSNGTRFKYTNKNFKKTDKTTADSSAFCSALAIGNPGSTWNVLDVFTIANMTLYVRFANINSLGELQQYLQQTPMSLTVILNTPIEIPLTPAEIAAYKALTAYAPDTVVQATDGAGLKLNYQRDVNIVIKNLEYAIASMTTT